MEKAYRAFKERQAQRRKAFGAFVALLIIEILLVAYTSYNAEWFRVYGIMITLFSFVFGVIYLGTRSWAREWHETDIFVSLYDAFKLLEYCSNEDEDSLFYSRKATAKVGDAIRILSKLSERGEAVNSKLVEKEFVEPLRKLEENLQKRILPRTAQRKDIENMIHVLRGLAKVFGEAIRPINLRDIVSRNKTLESYEPIELVEAPTKVRIILSKEPIRFSGSVGLGFLIVITAVLIHWKMFQTDLLDLIRSLTTFLEILAVGIALGLGIYAVFRRKP